MIDHAVLMVGYGERESFSSPGYIHPDPGSCINFSVLSVKSIPFWAIKNSWGEDYGEQVRQPHLQQSLWMREKS